MMSEPKDPAIKLFGKTIPFPETSDVPPWSDASDPIGGSESGKILQHPYHDLTCSPGSSHQNQDKGRDVLQEGASVDKDRENEKDTAEATIPGCKQEDGEDAPNTNAEVTETTETSVVEKDNSSSNLEGEEAEEEQNGTSGSQDTKLKKPDKILPCPRCKSMDTKFCYYNNYNVNQPRHLCKNCQRYWTAGGTMRNVPVGAGRRKNKNSVPHYRHITVNTDAMQEIPNAVRNANASILTFGSDALLSESMASSLTLADKAKRNGFHEPEQLKIHNTFNNSNRSPDPAGMNGFLQKNSGVVSPKVPCLPGPPGWSYPWNSVPWTVVPFYPPPAYWNCPVPPGAWNNVPWTAQPSSPSGSGSNSPRLGKHLREEENIVEPGKSKEDEASRQKNGSERNLWVPKTLRIDDPDEAAKSSIWETLGIKNEKASMFRAFRSGNEEKGLVRDNHPSALQANPAALSRSVSFNETS